MVRIATVVMLISVVAGCGSQAATHAAAPIIDPQRANAEVAGYVKLAREYLSRKEFDKAVETLERAVAIDGATDKHEATELLAGILPLHQRSTKPKPVKSERYSSAMGPAEVVQSYLASSTWQERVAFVLRPTEAGPQMAATYQNTRFDPSSYRPGTIVPLEKQSVPVGSQITVTVDVSESSPERPFWKYVLEHTTEGYKVDWQASQAIKWADEEATARRALQLDDPVLEVRVLKREQQHDATYLHFRATNRSNKHLKIWQLAIELSNPSGEYLTAETFSGFNLPAGEERVEKVFFSKLNPGQIAGCKFAPKQMTIDLGGQKTQEATKYFTVKVVK